MASTQKLGSIASGVRGVMPLLEEYFHNSRDRAATLAPFTPDALLVATSDDVGDEVFTDEDG